MTHRGTPSAAQAVPEAHLRDLIITDEQGRPVYLEGRAKRMVAVLVALAHTINGMSRGHVRFDFSEGELVPELRETFRKIRVE